MQKNDDTKLITSLTIPTSLDGVDADLNTLAKDQTYKITVDPNILAKLNSEVMLETALTQWLATRWRMSTNPNAFQISHSDSIRDNQVLGYLASSTPGAVLALLPAGKVAGVNRQSTAIFREQFFANQNKWPDLAVSNSSCLICLDAFWKWMPRQLYSDPLGGQVTDWEGYRLLVDNLIKSVTNKVDIRGDILSRSNEISTIFYELFKNTHDHARFDVHGAVIGDSVRGVYARFYPTEQLHYQVEETNVNSHEINPVDHYLHALLRHSRNRMQAGSAKTDLSGFLELSVFDTGPGLAAKWLGYDISKCSSKEQYEAVTHCFGKGYSSSPSGGRGFGLWRVLQELRRIKGFIRLRTNRVHVYRQYALLEDLFRVRHPDGHETPMEKFYDWRRQYSTALSEYPAVEGTLVSILLPLGQS